MTIYQDIIIWLIFLINIKFVYIVCIFNKKLLIMNFYLIITVAWLFNFMKNDKKKLINKKFKINNEKAN